MQPEGNALGMPIRNGVSVCFQLSGASADTLPPPEELVVQYFCLGIFGLKGPSPSQPHHADHKAAANDLTIAQTQRDSTF